MGKIAGDDDLRDRRRTLPVSLADVRAAAGAIAGAVVRHADDACHRRCRRSPAPASG